MTKSLLVLTSISIDCFQLSMAVQKCRTKLTMYLNSYQHNSSGSNHFFGILYAFSIPISQVWGANFVYFPLKKKNTVIIHVWNCFSKI